MSTMTLTNELLGVCSHCVGNVTATSLSGMEAFLAFESTGLCQSCQDVML